MALKGSISCQFEAGKRRMVMLKRLREVWLYFVLEGIEKLEAIYWSVLLYVPKNLRQYYAEVLSLEVLYARS